jgi:long-subunit fatty acid transport protein
VGGAGAAGRPSDPLTVSADVTWADWSQFTLRDAGERNPLTNRSQDTGECRDTLTCRLGAEYLLIYPKCIVPLRCGVGYDPGPSVDQTDSYYTASLGTGLQMGRYAFDLAYEARWGRSVNSTVYPDWSASENVLRHRVLASLIVYF